MSDTLIIFIKNLIKGKVKTRIARKIGPDLALEVYKLLLFRTLRLVAGLPAHIRPVFYFSDYMEEIRNDASFEILREVQEGNNLGERMSNAIKKEIDKGAGKVCLIGTDIYELSKEIIINAFKSLWDNEIVIGPAKDGGYYLIGMRKHYPELFSGIQWGESSVLDKTVHLTKSAGLQYHLLKPLIDVDEYGDVPFEIRKRLNLPESIKNQYGA